MNREGFSPWDALGQFIYELIQVAHRTREFIVEVLDLVATNGSCDQVGIGGKISLVEKSLECGFGGNMSVKVGLGVAREPMNDLEQLGLTPVLLFNLDYVVRIDLSKSERGDAFVVFGSWMCRHGEWCLVTVSDVVTG